MIEPTVLLILTVLSVICWGSFILKPKRLFDLLARAADRQFIKKPVGDFGFMVLMFIGIVTLLGLVNIERNFRQQEVQQAAQNSEFSDSGNETKKEPTKKDKVESEEEIKEKDKESESGQASMDDKKPTKKTVDPEIRANRASYSYAWQVLCCVLLVAVGRYLYGMQLFKVGFGPLVDKKFVDTLWVGLVAFVAIVPPVIWIHTGLTSLMGGGYSHSTLSYLQEIIKKNRTDLIIATFLQTAIGAALVEEFVFRGVLQGFVERFLRWKHNTNAILIGPLTEKMAGTFRIHPQTLETADPTFRKKVPRPPMTSGTFWVPIVVSSIAFAMIHIGQGAAPISLYILAMGLGFIYKVTGNLAVCMIVHFLLNAMTLTFSLINSLPNN